MTKWEYAYIYYDGTSPRPNGGVQTWFASIGGNNGYTEPIPLKENYAVIWHQQIAKLCDDGWEIFQVTHPFTNLIPPGRIFPVEGDILHFKRQY
jgi:hypothetical protein